MMSDLPLKNNRPKAGFRCPSCGEFFGKDKDAFQNHLNDECADGAVAASLFTTEIALDIESAVGTDD